MTSGTQQPPLQRMPSQWDLGVNQTSDDSSFYNASKAPSSARTDTSSEKENRKHPSDNLFTRKRRAALPKQDRRTKSGSHLVRFVNRPEGTPLFTISEQRSLATLKSKASNLTFTVRATRGDWSANGDLERDVITQGPKAASADDIISLAFLREQRSSSYSTDSVAKSGTQDYLSQPFKPPFDPPHRRDTPKGVRPWQHWLLDHPPRPIQAQYRRFPNNDIGDRPTRLRRALSSYIRSGFRTSPRPVTPVRPWRAPTSGHSTVGRDTLAQHPFQTASTAPV